MKIFNFFLKKIFLRKALIAFGILLLILLSNYLIFIAVRSTVSTLEGYDEIKHLNQENSYIANLDPDSDIIPENIGINDTTEVYDYLNDHFTYAFFTEGFITPLPNEYDMEISLSYLNEEYYHLNKQFGISQGNELNFDYALNDHPEIPVLIGKGLSETYPIGSAIEITEPVLHKAVTLKVHGILDSNISHSNLYSLSSKQYYNFSVIVPINKEFIQNSDISFQLQGLFDIILLQTTRDQVNDFGDVMYEKLGAKFNFFTQEENFEYFNEIFFSSMKMILLITAVLLVVMTCIAVWSSLSSIRLMIKDFTINLFVGLRYSKLRKILYGYYGLIFMINLALLFAITAFHRNACWLRKDATFCTYGFFGLIGMDWTALFSVLLFDILLGIILVEIMMWRIKKVPISLGVLQ